MGKHSEAVSIATLWQPSDSLGFRVAAKSSIPLAWRQDGECWNPSLRRKSCLRVLFEESVNLCDLFVTDGTDAEVLTSSDALKSYSSRHMQTVPQRSKRYLRKLQDASLLASDHPGANRRCTVHPSSEFHIAQVAGPEIQLSLLVIPPASHAVARSAP